MVIIRRKSVHPPLLYSISGLLFTLTFLFPYHAQASPLKIDLVISAKPYCKSAIVRNLTSSTLQVTLNYVVKGANGSHYSSSTSIGGTTFNGGANTGYYMTGLAPGEAATVSVNDFVAIPCEIDQEVSFSYTTTNVDTHNKQVNENESAERRALGNMIDKWNNEEQQRKQERLARQKEENAKRFEEAMKKQREFEAAPTGRACAQLGQYCDHRLIQNLPPPTVNYGTQDAHERALAEQRARQTQEQQQLDRDARIREIEIAKEHEAREAERQRQAQLQAVRAQAEWKAQQAAAQRAAQVAYERQQAEAAAERLRQAQWQQQVNLTTSLLQGSIQSSERTLANSRAELNEIVAMNSKEDEVLARVLAKAKAAQAQPETVAAARQLPGQSDTSATSATDGGMSIRECEARKQAVIATRVPDNASITASQETVMFMTKTVLDMIASGCPTEPGVTPLQVEAERKTRQQHYTAAENACNQVQSGGRRCVAQNHFGPDAATNQTSTPATPAEKPAPTNPTFECELDPDSEPMRSKDGYKIVAYDPVTGRNLCSNEPASAQRKTNSSRRTSSDWETSPGTRK